ncbi:MAG: histidine kinase [Pseudomonadota bacterium]|nr:histidine kinase [Pseudomonadota bacterium]
MLTGITPQRVATVVGLCLVWSLSNTIMDLPSVTEELGFQVWLAWYVGAEFACILLIAATMAIPLVVVGNLGASEGRRRYLALAVTIALLAPVAGVERVAWLAWLNDDPFRLERLSLIIVFWFRYAELAGLVAVIAEFSRRETRSVESMHRAEVDRLALDREMDEARMQVMQAQIEPHFLFNTLATVRRLYQTDLAKGRSILHNLMRYLEVALPQMRASESDVQRELALVESYLAVQKIRMEERLVFSFDVPAALRGLPLPPMMLLTLVENAIKHGLNPLPQGGSIHISARVAGSALEIEVVDTGRGFHATSGGGAGLANIQARLSALHGSAASLELRDNEPHGVVSTLRLPFEATP